MKEEMYVYTPNGVRYKVELGSETKMTLKWENNLFKSIDKVSCSYSYTFKIPVSRRNSEVFDLAEDVRHKSMMAWKKLKAEFIQNGIPLFRDANLYISKFSSKAYQCVFTWGVLDGLQKLADDSVSLQELEDKLVSEGVSGFKKEDSSNYAYWDESDGSIMTIDRGNAEEFDNMARTLHPNYWAGFSQIGAKNLAAKPPLPVVPTKFLLDCINKAYGINIQLGREAKGAEALKDFTEDKLFTNENVITFGCVPLVKAEMTDWMLDRNSLDLKYSGVLENKRILDTYKVLTFTRGTRTFGNLGKGSFKYVMPMYAKINSQSGSFNGYGVPSNDEMNNHKYVYTSIPKDENADDWAIIGFYSPFEVKIKGSMVVKVNEAIKYSKKKDELKEDTVFHMKIKRLSVRESYKDRDEWGNSKDWEVEDESTISNVSSDDKTTFFSHNVFDSNGKFLYSIYYFNFQPEDGYDAVSAGNEGRLHEMDGHTWHYYFFCFENGTVKEMVRCSNITIEPQINDAKKLTHEMDIFSNLPDIDCLAFVKSLYYAMGEYPYVDKDGAIRGVGYKNYEDCIENGDVVDWSKKLTGSVSDIPEEIEYKAGDFKQKNYYLTKWDDLDRTEEELKDEENVYEDGIGCIVSENDTLKDEETVYTFPFYGPFILNRKQPKMWTGDSVKFWDWDYPDVTYKECKPAYGIITSMWPSVAKPTQWNSTTYEITQGNIPINSNNTNWMYHQMLMKVLNPFADMKKNPNYAYLQRIVRNPITITESLYLNEIDLAELDMRKPVYISKYNSFFAIVSIQRNSNGISKCKLLKLPSSNKVLITFTPSGKGVHYVSNQALKYPLKVMISVDCVDTNYWGVEYTIPANQTEGDLVNNVVAYSVSSIDYPRITSRNKEDDNDYTLKVK